MAEQGRQWRAWRQPGAWSLTGYPAPRRVAPGTWTLRTLAPKAEPVDRQVVAQYGEVAEVAVAV